MYSYIQAFISLFCIMNPLLAITIYLNVTYEMNYRHKQLVLTVCGITVFTILIVCLFVGEKVLQLLGVHQYALQLAGGLIVLLIGITTILKPESAPVLEHTDSSQDRVRVISMGISPLALPMIIGPGGMVLMMLYSQKLPGITNKLILSAVALLVTVSIVLVLSVSGYIRKFLGDIGVLVLTKVMGLLLTAIAFEMLISGVKSVMPVIMGH
jgi:multiple antibiotic resistance protein